MLACLLHFLLILPGMANVAINMIGLTDCSPKRENYNFSTGTWETSKTTCSSTYVNIIVLVFGALTLVFTISFIITINCIITAGLNRLRTVNGMPINGLNGLNMGMYQQNMMMPMGQPMVQSTGQPMGQSVPVLNPYNMNSVVY